MLMIWYSKGRQDSRYRMHKVTDALSTLVHTDCRMLYVWLDVEKTVRDKRRITRERDAADKAESLTPGVN